MRRSDAARHGRLSVRAAALVRVRRGRRSPWPCRILRFSDGRGGGGGGRWRKGATCRPPTVRPGGRGQAGAPSPRGGASGRPGPATWAPMPVRACMRRSRPTRGRRRVCADAGPPGGPRAHGAGRAPGGDGDAGAASAGRVPCPALPAKRRGARGGARRRPPGRPLQNHGSRLGAGGGPSPWGRLAVAVGGGGGTLAARPFAERFAVWREPAVQVAAGDDLDEAMLRDVGATALSSGRGCRGCARGRRHGRTARLRRLARGPR